MKHSNAFILYICLFFSISSFASNLTTKTILVNGSCEMCKARIEKACKKAGTTSGVWDQKTHQLTVTFDSNQTSTEKIEKAIANAGYDTENNKATEKAYSKLPDCCKYDRE